MQETWTTEDYKRHINGGHVPRQPSDKPIPKAVGRNHTPGVMNKLEQRYAAILAEKHRSGIIAWWAYEPIKLRLADKTFYTPDFGVLYAANMTFEFIEVKGHWEDDARVKIKVAARLVPFFSFVAMKPNKGGEFEGETF